MTTPETAPARPDAPAPAPAIGRRAVVAGAAVLGTGLVVAGCGGPGGGTTGSGTPAPAGPVGAAADVPVGSAVIFSDKAIVVTQATEGTFAAFSTVCPHNGCNVASVEGAEIVCPCHGSRFALDGAVVSGPAPTGLESRPVVVEGDQITLQ